MWEEKFKAAQEQHRVLSETHRLHGDALKDYESLFDEMKKFFEKRIRWLEDTMQSIEGQDAQFLDEDAELFAAKFSFLQKLQKTKEALASSYDDYVKNREEFITTLAKQVAKLRRPVNEAWITLGKLQTFSWIEENVRKSSLPEESRDTLFRALQDLHDGKIELLNDTIVADLEKAGVEVQMKGRMFMMKDGAGNLRAGFLQRY